MGEIEGVLENSGLDRRKFNRGNQGKWMEKVNAWAQEETLSYQLPDALGDKAATPRWLHTERQTQPPPTPAQTVAITLAPVPNALHGEAR
ncbi:hypothetical protein LAN33_23305, partial [Mycobacterium tuberculosis]|nr:hypothetical protein [Mycobacterium tuberculosis]